MTEEEQLALAREVLGPSTKVIEIRYNNRPDLVVISEDEYGQLHCRITDGDFLPPHELRERLEGHQRGRDNDIKEWEHQKVLSAQIVAYLTGERDPDHQMEFLPGLVYRRFLDDFRIQFPELEILVKAPKNANKAKVIEELTTIPFSWQKSP